MKYAYVIERGPTSYGAYVPDLPGCVAVASSEAEVRRKIRAAVEFHVEGLIAEGFPVPEPSSIFEEFDIEVPALAFANKDTFR